MRKSPAQPRQLLNRRGANKSHSRLVALILLVTSLAFLCPMVARAEYNSKLETSVTKAIDGGDYKTAYGMLFLALSNSLRYEQEGSVEDWLIQLAFTQTTNHVQSLSSRTITTNITTIEHLEFQEALWQASTNTWQEIKKEWYKVLLPDRFTTDPWLYGRALEMVYEARKGQQEHYSNIEEFKAANEAFVSKMLDQYDVLKDFIQKWIDLERTQATSLKNVSRHLKTIKHLERVKTKVVQNREQFLSYEVLSPILAETSRRLALAKKTWVGHHKTKVRSAVDYLSDHAKQEWPKQCNREVRLQFLDLLKEFKNLAGEKEFGDLEVRAAIMKSDSDKTIGGKSWWP